MSNLEMNNSFESIDWANELNEEQKVREQGTQNIIDEINNMKEQNPELEAVYNKYWNHHPSRILREMKAYEEIKGEEDQDLESLMEVSLMLDIVDHQISYRIKNLIKKYWILMM